MLFIFYRGRERTGDLKYGINLVQAPFSAKIVAHNIYHIKYTYSENFVEKLKIPFFITNPRQAHRNEEFKCKKRETTNQYANYI